MSDYLVVVGLVVLVGLPSIVLITVPEGEIEGSS